MKKITLLIATLTLSFNKLSAQQWVLDEIYEEQHATQSDDVSLGYIVLGLIMLIAAIFVIGLIFSLFKKYKDGIADFFADFEGCGCLLLIFGIVGFLALVGVIK